MATVQESIIKTAQEEEKNRTGRIGTASMPHFLIFHTNKHMKCIQLLTARPVPWNGQGRKLVELTNGFEESQRSNPFTTPCQLNCVSPRPIDDVYIPIRM